MAKSARVVATNPNILGHLQVIFGIMVACGVHREISPCARGTVDAWRGVFDAYFGATGGGRAFTMWADWGQGLSKFRASVMAALTHHADAYDAGDLSTTDFLVAVRLQAHDMMVERHAATAAAAAAAAAAEVHRGQLNDTNCAMGMLPSV